MGRGQRRRSRHTVHSWANVQAPGQTILPASFLHRQAEAPPWLCCGCLAGWGGSLCSLFCSYGLFTSCVATIKGFSLCLCLNLCLCLWGARLPPGGGRTSAGGGWLAASGAVLAHGVVGGAGRLLACGGPAGRAGGKPQPHVQSCPKWWGPVRGKLRTVEQCCRMVLTGSSSPRTQCSRWFQSLPIIPAQRGLDSYPCQRKECVGRFRPALPRLCEGLDQFLWHHGLVQPVRPASPVSISAT